jgi:putative membrane protein
MKKEPSYSTHEITKTTVRSYFPHFLLAIYLVLFIVCARNPYDRAVRRAENIPVFATVLFLVLTYHKFQFSALAYGLMSIWIFMHTVGGHYTFEHVPFDWVNQLFGFERNMYDRIAHFTIGFYAFPLAEYLTKKKLTNSKRITLLFAIFAVFTLASVYEIIERRYAVGMGGDQGASFLGSQGDIRDAQKDMLADGLGAIVSVLLFVWRWSVRKKKE